MKSVNECRHESAIGLEGVDLPAYLAPRPGHNVAAECEHCGVVFMAVRCDDGKYRDYRDVDYGGRRP
jgi:hypothetical protein